MSRHARNFPHVVLAALLGIAWLGALVPAGAAPEDPKEAGRAYHNASLGVRARAPAGWRMVADKGAAPTTWQRLVTFNDTQTDAQAVLSVRPRQSAALDDLLADVRKSWEQGSSRLRISSMRKIEASALSPVAQVVVDASFTRPARPAKGKEGVPPPPGSGTVYRVQAVYLLGPGQTYLLYAQGQETHWSRLRGPLEGLRQSIKFDRKVDAGPVGEGAYRNEEYGFSCVYPKDYAVVVPQRSTHVVQFEGVGDQDPVLSVYVLKWEQDAAKDAERLVAYYEGDMGGLASASSIEVSGRQGMQVRAKAVIGGQERVVLLAIVKRGDDCFRLRASVPVAAEASGARVYKAFLAGFKLGATPR